MVQLLPVVFPPQPSTLIFFFGNLGPEGVVKVMGLPVFLSVVCGTEAAPDLPGLIVAVAHVRLGKYQCI